MEKSNLKGLLIIILIIAVGFVVYVTATPSEGKVLRVSGHEDWPPIMFHDGHGSIKGIGSEFVKGALESLDYDAEFKYEGSWDEVQKKASEGRVDVIVALYETKERQRYLLFSDPYVEDPISVFFANKTGTFDYSQKERLINKTGIVTKGDSYGELDQYIKDQLTVIVADNPEEAKEMLLQEKGDYFLYTTYGGTEKLFKNEIQEGIIEHSVIGGELFCIGVSRKTPDAEKIVTGLNKYIKEKSMLT